ncbi:MAG: prepilin peptidase [bacterium]|nr:prepilin peptidase [bacterium]
MIDVAVVILGMLIGSFLNVCIWRVPLRISVSNPRRSFCPKCKHQILWYENIPVFSWLFLRGRCSSCSEKIGIRYPLVELASGAVAWLCLYHFGFTPTAGVIYVFCAVLIVITFIDLDHKIIPNRINFPGIWAGLFLALITENFPGVFEAPLSQSLFDSLIGAALGYGIFNAIFWAFYFVTKKEGLGYGDMKFMAMVGAIFGWQMILPTIFIASVAGSVVGLIYLKITGDNEIPFGPWLALGVFLQIFLNLPLFQIPV